MGPFGLTKFSSGRFSVNDCMGAGIRSVLGNFPNDDGKTNEIYAEKIEKSLILIEKVLLFTDTLLIKIVHNKIIRLVLVK